MLIDAITRAWERSTRAHDVVVRVRKEVGVLCVPAAEADADDWLCIRLTLVVFGVACFMTRRGHEAPREHTVI